MTAPAPGQLRFPALGTTAALVTEHPDGLAPAGRAVRRVLSAIDRTCSRFRADSEISRLHARAGRPTTVSPLLAEALDVALRAAELTDGLVDPTVGAALRAVGYDRDFALIEGGDPRPPAPSVPAPGWWRLRREPGSRRFVLPRGIVLDLGATAKALAADLAAAAAADAAGCGVLVNLGGDLAVAGPAPAGSWRVAIGDDHLAAERDPAIVVAVTSGGLATSSTTRRRWRRGDRIVHHLIDPRTGDAVAPHWRTASVAAASCVDANTATTAAIVLGADAPAWLSERAVPARLVAVDGRVLTVAGWPEEVPVP
ncbi:FAD:protein FMN transferase [Actinoplanes sp. KI2]|uniref:FAD:protein FMN transferase n=1 Tax=Actinoplanes sp. KI2 TaxID=2983315 RepID=UPI0021D60B9C|nr:FAD:protein FMN transferase [Actinoplanes sp. KI2]MCU7729464.1 FAD:protein FMN transferase [Actinoplanes sp. KI2]